MLIIRENHAEHFAMVCKFAAENGVVGDLLDKLDFLHTYACIDEDDRVNRDKTICYLYPDGGMTSLSFGFQIMQRRSRSVNEETGQRIGIGVLKGREISDYDERDHYRHWFIGGLIYSGPGFPSDGSAPNFTVSLDPDASGGVKHMWSVHT
jgi:hypothetical protein